MASETDKLSSIAGRGGIRLRTPDGRQLRLHSAVDPVGEAARWIRDSGEGVPGAVIVIGFGEGYLLDALARNGSSAPLIALEPDASIAAAWHRSERAAVWTAAKKLRLLVGPEYAGAEDAWRDLAEDARILVHPVYARECPAAVERAEGVARRIMFDAEANREARRRLERIYRSHTWHNVPAIVASGDVRTLFGKFQGCPAILVGAGPSLDAALPALSPLRDRALIVAADTTLRPLLAAGVVPHLVVSADPTELNGRHLRDIPVLPGSWLVAEPSVHPAAFRSFAGRTYTFRVAAHDPWPRLQAHGLDRGFLHIWGSVLTAAFDLTLRLGCGPIAFVGADLAFSGGRPYCRNTIFEESWARGVAAGRTLPQVFGEAVGRWPDLYAADIHDRPTRTAPHLVAFRDWIVAHAARHGDRTILNATDGGILHGPGIVQTTAEALVREFAPRETILPTLDACAAAAADQAAVFSAPAALLAEAARDAGELEQGESPGAWTSLAPWGLPERVAVLDAIAGGVAIPSCLGASAPAPPPPADGELVRTLAGLVGIAHPARGYRDGAYALQPAAVGYWADESMDAALRLERWTLEAAAHAGEEFAIAASAESIGGDLDPVLLALLRAAWLRARATPDIVPLHLLRLLRLAVPRWAATPGTPHDDDFLLTIDAFVGGAAAASARVSTRMATPALLSTWTGAIVREPPAGFAASGGPGRFVLVPDDASEVALRVDATYLDGRPSRVVRPATAWVAPLMLSGGVFPNAARVTPLDDTEAIVTPWSSNRSYAVDERGAVRALPPWPQVISGELRCGSGHVAWSNGTPTRLLFRDADDGPVSSIEVPFQTSRMLPLADGSVLAVATVGGLWRCDRERGTTRVADVAPGILVRVTNAVAWTEEIVRTSDGLTARTLDGSRVDVALSTGQLSRTPLTSDGPCWAAAGRDRWEARAHPHTDTVMLDHPEAGRFALFCGYPTSVVWIGDSLLVGNAYGHACLFPRLLEVLHACRA